MKTFKIYATNVVSTVKKIEAETLDEAIDIFYEEGVTGLVFLDHNYPDEGEWEVDEEATREINQEEK